MEMATRAFGGSNVMALVRNESSTDALVAMLASCPPVGQLQVQRGGVGMELDAVVSSKRGYSYPAFEAGSQGDDVLGVGDEDLGDDCSGAHNVEKKRRLSFDQVRSLERNFEVENKLEPERKMQLAKELGLQPRQVAVWFQNRRARWKTKQLERDYEVLTLDYNRLKSDYDAVVQEKQELQGEIDCLTEKLQASPTTAQAEKAAAPAKSTRPKAAAPTVSQLLPPSERMPPSAELAPSVGKPHEEIGSCSDSINSSEVLDADSPRTTDSAAPLEKLSVYPHVASIPADSNNIIHNICDQIALSPQRVKLEDGSFQDESSCNYILTQLDEERALPWWDWP